MALAPGILPVTHETTHDSTRDAFLHFRIKKRKSTILDVLYSYALSNKSKLLHYVCTYKQYRLRVPSLCSPILAIISGSKKKQVTKISDEVGTIPAEAQPRAGNDRAEEWNSYTRNCCWGRCDDELSLEKSKGNGVSTCRWTLVKIPRDRGDYGRVELLRRDPSGLSQPFL